MDDDNDETASRVTGMTPIGRCEMGIALEGRTDQ
jgi:hypothetical protein